MICSDACKSTDGGEEPGLSPLPALLLEFRKGFSFSCLSPFIQLAGESHTKPETISVNTSYFWVHEAVCIWHPANTPGGGEGP